MDFLQFLIRLQEKYNYDFDSHASIVYFRNLLYNTHTLNLENEDKETRLELLIKFDQFYGTPINERHY